VFAIRVSFEECADQCLASDSRSIKSKKRRAELASQRETNLEPNE